MPNICAVNLLLKNIGDKMADCRKAEGFSITNYELKITVIEL